MYDSCDLFLCSREDGQVKHLDIAPDSSENHVVVALPVRLDSDPSLAWQAVGTSVVKGCRFSWTQEPDFDLDLCKVSTRFAIFFVLVSLTSSLLLFLRALLCFPFLSYRPSYSEVTAPCRELHQTPRCYSALVANKILHGGGLIPARSKRATLFLLFSPPATYPLYEDTIPATTFLMTDENTGELMLPSKTALEKDIQGWCDVVDVSFHYKQSAMTPERKSLIGELQAMEGKRRGTGELVDGKPKKRAKKQSK